MDNFNKNMIALRNKHNLTTTQVATIAGVEKATYEKMELGFEKVSYEVIEKLAKFYNVDVTYFAQENKDVLQQGVQTVKSPKVKKERAKMVKVSNILTMITACLLLACFIIVPIYSDYGVTVFVWHMFGGYGIAIALVLFMLLYTLWAFVHAILHLSSANIDLSVYGFVSKIISVALCAFTFAFGVIYFIVSNGLPLLMLIHLSVTLVDLIFVIIKLVAHVKATKK